MLDEAGEVGPRTLECIILKARYSSAIADVCRLGMSLSADPGSVVWRYPQRDGQTGEYQQDFLRSAYGYSGRFTSPN